MNGLNRRLNNLEHRFGIARDAPPYLVVMSDGELGPVEDAYIQILVERGEFPPGVFSVVNLEGITRDEAERFVRENEVKSTDRIKPREVGERTPIIQVELE